MTVLAAIVVAAALLEHRDLLALGLRDDLGRNRDRRGVGDRAVAAGEQNIAQGDRVAGFTRQLLDRDLVSGGNPVLLAARAHYCEHGVVTRPKYVSSVAPAARTGILREGSSDRLRATRRLPAAKGRGAERVVPLVERRCAVNALARVAGRGFRTSRA